MDQLPAGLLPLPLRLALKPAGLLPLGPVLTFGLRRFAGRRPDVFERMGEFSLMRFWVAPTDLDFGFLIQPDGRQALIRTFLKNGTKASPKTGEPASEVPASEVQVRGPLLALLGLLDGTYDGDALFFNRIIAVSGRTDALLALRNAIEAAELQPSDVLGLSGGPARLIDRAVLATLAELRRLSSRSGIEVGDELERAI